jgi:hypothetical protein
MSDDERESIINQAADEVIQELRAAEAYMRANNGRAWMVGIEDDEGQLQPCRSAFTANLYAFWIGLRAWFRGKPRRTVIFDLYLKEAE